jgi:hypothetical protein
MSVRLTWFEMFVPFSSACKTGTEIIIERDAQPVIVPS